MDINYLLEREQVERVRADTAAGHQARAAHRGLADGYRRRIDSHRDGAPDLSAGQVG